MTLPVAILAGGLAKRLHPITQTTPKALVDVAGKPFILRQLEYLKTQGISDAVLCVSHLGEQIEAVVGDGSGLGLNVRYVWDGPRLLGTGGALRRALPLLGRAFFVQYGDSYLPVDFGDVARDFLASGKPALMTVLKNGNRWDTSNVVFKDNRIILYNKLLPGADMEHIDYGLGVFSAAVLEAMPADTPFDLAEVYHALSLEGRLAGHEVHERFYEIGSHQGLAETIHYFSKER